jgi:CRP-like cAMP-binding protein
MAKPLPELRLYAQPKIDGAVLQNELLLRLPGKECEIIYSQLTFTALETHSILNEAESQIKYAYFMNSGLASVLNVMPDGKIVEVGLTGKEGFVGLPLIVGFKSSPSRIIIQVSGSAFRIKTVDLLKTLRTCGALEKRLHRYSQILATQGYQVAACNRLHETDERLARWLLMSQDRLISNTIDLSQEFLAHMLGTRLSSVTIAASILERAGLIRYTREQVKILNRQGLEDAACECYEALVRQSARWDQEAD